MAIDWKVVTSAHVDLACDDYDAGDRPASPSRNIFLLTRGRRYPAKFIRGRAYRIATGTELDPNRDYSGGQETVRFLVERGFAVEYRGEIHPRESALGHKGDLGSPRRPEPTSSSSCLKIGLLSFAVDKDHPELTRGNERVVLEILSSNPDLDLLVGAGWTVFSEDELAMILEKNPNVRGLRCSSTHRAWAHNTRPTTRYLRSRKTMMSCHWLALTWPLSKQLPALRVGT